MAQLKQRKTQLGFDDVGGLVGEDVGLGAVVEGFGEVDEPGGPPGVVAVGFAVTEAEAPDDDAPADAPCVTVGLG